MLSPEERFMIGLRVLEQLRPILRRERMSKRQAVASPSANKPPGPDETQPTAPVEATEMPSLQAFLEANPLGQGSVAMGVCQDGVLLSLELDNPAPGSILISGDQGSGKTRFLRSLLASAVLINEPDQVAFHIVARRSEEYADLDVDHCQGLFSYDDPGVADLLQDLIHEGEARRLSRTQGNALLLIIDDLGALLPQLNKEAFTHLYWLAHHGPRSRIWVLASLATRDISRVDPRLLSVFRSRLIGHMTDLSASISFSARPDPPASELVPGLQFCTWLGGEWLQLWICEADPLFPHETPGDSS
jgi:hypothetical protein